MIVCERGCAPLALRATVTRIRVNPLHEAELDVPTPVAGAAEEPHPFVVGDRP
ncbi:MAG TPA: hypothetical protein VIJ48_10160 [Acidimicrobiia bacterium]